MTLRFLVRYLLACLAAAFVVELITVGIEALWHHDWPWLGVWLFVFGFWSWVRWDEWRQRRW